MSKNTVGVLRALVPHLKEVVVQIRNGRITGEHIQALIEHRNPFLKQWEGSLFDPNSYFVDRKGLHVQDSFKDLVLANRNALVVCRGASSLVSRVLHRPMTDLVIAGETVGDVEEMKKRSVTLDQIAEKISAQPSGEKGDLLTNEEANIFFVLVDSELLVVNVYLDPQEEALWMMGAWTFGEYGIWNDGSKVFFNVVPTR